MRIKIISGFVFLSALFIGLAAQDQDQEKIDKYFDMDIQELMNVDIYTAGKTNEKIKDIPASVVLVTREDIETYGYRTLAETLEHIPGLYNIGDYSTDDPNFGVRGFWSGVANDNMIILVNGVQQVDDIFSNYPLYKIAVPVEAIDRIEVIRGPMSVIYGSGAFFGAINIITNEITGKPSNIVSASTGSAKTNKFFARAAGKEGNFSYIINASLLDTGGLDYPLSDMMSEPVILPSLGVPVDSRTGGKLENNEKYFNFSGTFKDIALYISYNETKKEFYFSVPSLSAGSSIKNITSRISFAYRKELSRSVTLEGKFSYATNRDWVRYNILFEDFFGMQRESSNTLELELNAFIKISPRMDLTAGMAYQSILNVSDVVDLPSFGVPYLENRETYLAGGDNIITRALFAQVKYSPTERLKLIAGARLEQSPTYELKQDQTLGTTPTVKLSGIYGNDKTEIIPRFAAIYHLDDRNTIKLLFGKAINRPSFFQNSKNTLSPLLPELSPESIQTLELNYIASLSSVITINAGIFRNILENLITRIVRFDAQTNDYETWSANAGKMVTHGIELTLNIQPIQYFRLELSGSYQETKDKRSEYKNIEIAYSPKFLGYLKASYRSNKMILAITGNYVGAMETFWDEALPTPARIGEKVGGYFVMGANLRLENVFTEGLYINVRCSNLLDTEIRYPTFTNNPMMDRGTIGIGRTFLAGIGWKF